MAGESFANSVWYSPELSKSRAYRIEPLFNILSVDSGADTALCNLHMRIYDEVVSPTVPAFTDADFVDRNESGRLLSTTPNMTLFSYTAAFGTLWTGNNDDLPSPLHSYQGGFAISDENWCGPYNPGESP